MYFSGLDLGAAADFTALAVLERKPTGDSAGPRRYRYSVAWLERWELGTLYTQIADGVRKRFEGTPLQHSDVAVDYTGVGRPVMEQLQAVGVPAGLTPILITCGHEVTKDARTGAYHVPKKELVSTVQVLLQNGLLKWSPKLPLAERLERELSDFRVKLTTSGNETFSAWRDSQHDDLVLAVALAAWLGERSIEIGPDSFAADYAALGRQYPRGVFD
jgi:hypothetical protein